MIIEHNPTSESRESAPADNSAWRRHAAPVAILIIAILLANAIALSNIFNGDPALTISGLGTAIVRGPWYGRPNWYDDTIGTVVEALGHACAQDWLYGRIPWWNYGSGTGMPQAAELQNYALFLPFVLLLHFSAGWLWLRVLLQLMAGSFMYVLAIELSLTRHAALMAGTLYACMGSFIMIPHAPAATFVFLPSLIMGIERARRHACENAPIGWSFVTFSVAYSFYAGFPETAFLGDFLGGIWFLIRIGALPRLAAMRFGAKFAISVLLGILITLPGLIPFVEYLRLGDLGDHAGVYAAQHLPLIGLSIEFLPLLFGPLGSTPIGPHPELMNDLLQKLFFAWQNTGGWFAGLPLLLGIAGIFVRNDWIRPVKYMLVAWIIFWQLRVFGATGVTTLINLIPPMRLIDIERFSEPSCDFALILMAACALDDWQRGAGFSRARTIGTGLGAAAIIAACMLIARPTITALDDMFAALGAFANLYGMAIFCLLAFTLILLAQRPRPAAVLALSTLVLGSTVAGFALGETAGAAAGHVDRAGITYLAAHTGLQRVFSMGPLAPNYGALYGIAEIDHNMLPVPKLWTAYIVGQLDPYSDHIVFNGRFLGRPTNVPDEAAELRRNLANYEAIGVKYVLSPPDKNPFAGMEAPPPLVFHNGVMDIYQLPSPAPYFSASGLCTLAPASRQALTADCPHPATLTRLELFYPGWHATVNGNAVPIIQTGKIFQAIALPAGHAQIRFWYRPTHTRSAAGIAAASCCVWLVCCLRARRRRNSLDPGAPHLT